MMRLRYIFWLCLLPAVQVQAGVLRAQGETVRTQAEQMRRDTIPRPVGFVNDFEHLFTPQQIDSLDDLIHAFEQRTTIEIAVITIDTSLTMPGNFDFFTLKTMSAWGVGKRDKNNGILIGISRVYRKIRIQNAGGILKLLPNADTKSIIDGAFLPFFRKDQYYAGTLSGLKTLMQRLE